MELRMSRPLLVMAVVMAVCVIKSQSAYNMVIENDWKIIVQTGTISRADTDDGVYIKLYGKKGETSRIRLDGPGNDFEFGALNVFKITAKDVGAITKIKVWGGQDGDGWLLDEMSIEPDNKMYSFPAYLFECYCWFDGDNGNPKIRPERFLIPRIVTKKIWKITTYTGDDYHAGTYDEISITINESKGSTGWVSLNPRHTSVNRLGRNVYYISVLDKGTPDGVTVRASEHGDAWQLMRIELETLNGGQLDVWVFNAGESGQVFDSNGKPGTKTQEFLILKKESSRG